MRARGAARGRPDRSVRARPGNRARPWRSDRDRSRVGAARRPGWHRPPASPGHTSCVRRSWSRASGHGPPTWSRRCRSHAVPSSGWPGAGGGSQDRRGRASSASRLDSEKGSVLNTTSNARDVVAVRLAGRADADVAGFSRRARWPGPARRFEESAVRDSAPLVLPRGWVSERTSATLSIACKRRLISSIASRPSGDRKSRRGLSISAIAGLSSPTAK